MSRSDVAPIRRPRSDAAKSLSITASTPTSSAPSRVTGTPPPPQAITTSPPSSSRRISAASTTSRGIGEGTTRLQPRPESSVTDQPRASARRRARPSEKKGPIGLVGFAERRVLRIDHDLGHDGGDRGLPVGGDEGVADGLGDQVAQLSLGHRAQHEERLRRHLAAHGLLGHREGTHLGPVAVHDQQPVAGGHDPDGGPGHRARPLLLVGEVPEPGRCEGVAADRQDDRLAQDRLLLVAGEPRLTQVAGGELHRARQGG